MQQYTVTGMSCAACQARVEKAVEGVEGVESCAVSLLTNSMGVQGTANPDDIIKAVENAGYGAAIKNNSSDNTGNNSANKKNPSSENLKALEDKETPLLIKRLIASVFFLAILMYFSMGHMMFGWPLPEFLKDNHVGMGILQLLLSGIIMVINQRFFISGFKSLFHGAPNMDTLVAMGAGASFGYSVYALFAMTVSMTQNDSGSVMALMDEFYFESAATILTLITVGKTLEARSKGKTTDALKSLMKLSPTTATVERDGIQETIPVDEVQKEDIFLVKPGEQIPVDGIVVEGATSVDEAALTGESIPVDKEPGMRVSAGTLNKSGFIKAKALRVGEDTTLSQIIKMVSDAAATKAPIAKTADKVSGVFVPAVIGIALITLAIWLLAGQTPGFALARAISVLVISCPCALGLATPVAIMVGNGVGARAGILFKTASSLEETGRIRIVALDKTGTITKGEPAVTDIIPVEGMEKIQLLQLAYTLEQHSEHPLASAIVEEALSQDIYPEDITDFSILPGNGVEAVCEGHLLQGGSLSYVNKIATVPEFFQSMSEILGEQGKTPLYFAMDGEVQGIIAVADVIKPDSARAIKELRGMGIRVVMLTGDNRSTASAIGRVAGVDEVIAQVMPDGKEEVIRRLQNYAKTAMVGDGINDAPALTAADTGIAIGAGTDVAIDAADVVLMNSSLMDVPAAIRLSRKTLKNIHQNLFWAFFYNVIGIPLAAGLWIPFFGLKLNPMFGAAAMSLSSFCVVMNALRLNLANIRSTKGDKKLTPVIIDPNEKLPSGGAAGQNQAIQDFSGAEGLDEEDNKEDLDIQDIIPSFENSEDDFEEKAPDEKASEEEASEEIISEGKASEEESPKPESIPENEDLKDDGMDAPKEDKDNTEEKAHSKEEGGAPYEGFDSTKKETDIMEKTFNVEGMMCAHCEANVKGALEAMDGITEAVPSHEKGTVVIKLSSEVSDDAIKATIEEKGYKVV